MSAEKLGRRAWLCSSVGVVAGCLARKDRPVPSDPAALGLPPARDTWHKTRCGACPAACGLEVRMQGGRAIGVRGDRTSRSQGRLCPLGQASVHGLYHPLRVRGPLARKGHRGQGRYEAITWDQALTQVADHLASAKAKGGSDFIKVVEGLPSPLTTRLWDRLLLALGSPRLHKHPLQGPQPNLASASYILAFSDGALESGPTWISLVAALAQPHRPWLGCVAPRRPLTGPTPDDFILVRPGTHVLFQFALAECLYRLQRDRKPGLGGMEQFASEHVAAALGVSRSVIEPLAHRLCAEKKVALLPADDFASPVAIRALRLLQDALGERLAGDSVELSDAPWPLDDPSHQQVLILAGDGAGAPRNVLEETPQVISFTSALGGASPFADLVLPIPHFLERWEVEAEGPYDRSLWLRQPVVRAGQDVRAVGTILLDLAKRLGMGPAEALPWHDYPVAVADMLAPEAYAGLQSAGCWKVEGPAPADPVAVTPRLPPASDLIASIPRPSEDFPCMLIPLKGWVDRIPGHPLLNDLPLLESPSDLPRVEVPMDVAHALGLQQGQPVRVETSRFSLSARAHPRDGLHAQCVALSGLPMEFPGAPARIRKVHA